MNDIQNNEPLPWHTQSSENVMQTLKTGSNGLSNQEAKKRLACSGNPRHYDYRRPQGHSS